MGAIGFTYDQESLFAGLSILLRGIPYPSQAEETISSSFESAARGLGIVRGGLFLVRHQPDSVRLEALCHCGMTTQQIRAIECGKDLEDRATGSIWKIFRQSCAQEPPVPRVQPWEPIQRISPDLYVLTYPILDPVFDAPAAILYFEKETGSDPEFEAVANKWITPYALALGQIIHLGFPRLQSVDETEAKSIDIKTLENAPELVGVSVHTQALRQELHEIHMPAASVPDPDPILILGEKGTGKDLVTRYIYAYSSRRNRPYVAVNCAEITDELATARFFGHKKGSFTGSLANEPGLFRAADHGVL